MFFFLPKLAVVEEIPQTQFTEVKVASTYKYCIPNVNYPKWCVWWSKSTKFASEI